MPKFSVFPESGVGVARKFQWRVERSSEEGARIEAPQASIGRVCEIGDTAVQEVYEQHIRGYTFCCKYASGNFLLPKTAKKRFFRTPDPISTSQANLPTNKLKLLLLPVAQMMESTSSTHVPSVNRTPVGIRRAMPGRTCTLPDRIRLGRSSFVTSGLASMLWLGFSPYRAWSNRAFTCFRTSLQTKRDGIK